MYIKNIKEIFKENEIILIGENHATAKNYDLWFELIRIANEKYGINQILMEVGYSTAKLLEKFLLTGDEKKLDYIMNSFQSTYSYSKEVSLFLKNLYLYNKDLTKDKKLKLIGVDIEHQIFNAFKFMETLCDDNIKELHKVKELIKGVDNNVKLNIKIAIMIYKIINNKTIKEKLAGKYFDFNMAIVNTIRTYKYFTCREEEKTKYRERCMISNFEKIYFTCTNKTFIGQMGKLHVKKVGNTVANWLNEKYVYTKGKVLSVYCYYINSKYLEYNDEKVEISNIMGFELDGENFEIVGVENNRDAGYDNIIFIRDSKAVERYN